MPSASTERERRHGRHLWRAVLVVVLVLLGLVAALFVVAAVEAPALAAYAAKKVVPEVSQAIGQPVAIGRVDARIFPSLGIELDRVSVAPAAAGEPDLADVDRITAKVGFWRFVWSLGKRVEVREIRLDGPRLNLVRRPNRTWNYQQVAQNVAARQKQSNRKVEVSVVQIRGGRIGVLDRSSKPSGVGGGPSAEKAGPRPGRATPAPGGGDLVVAIDHIDASARGIGDQRPASIRANAAIASDRQNVSLQGTIEPPPSSRARATFAVSNARLGDFRSALPAGMGALVRGGLLSFHGNLSDEPDRGFRVTGDGNVDRLSAGDSTLAATFSLTAAAGSGPGAPSEVDIGRFALRGDGVDVGGRASIRSAAAASRNVDFTLSGPRLDLDPLLAISRAAEQNEGQSAVPADIQGRLAGTQARGAIDIASVHAGKLSFENVKGQGTLSKGVLSLEQASANLYGGTATLAGTEIDFTASPAAWRLREKLDGFDLGQAAQDLFGARVIAGKGGTEVQLSGAGSAWPQARDSVSGSGRVSLANGTLGYDLGERFAQPIVQALQKLGLGSAAGALGSAEQTRIDALDAAFTVDHGWAAIPKSLRLDTSIGKLSLTGRVRLDGQLELAGNADLDSSFLSRISPALARGPLSVPVTFRGTLADPAVSVALDPGQIGQQLLKNTFGH